jgi:hypothetical protein
MYTGVWAFVRIGSLGFRPTLRRGGIDGLLMALMIKGGIARPEERLYCRYRYRYRYRQTIWPAVKLL